ncbi:unnamed protein product [Ascophyllum nodosum]
MPPEMGTGSLNFDEGTGDALSLSPPPPPPDRTGGKPSDSSGSTCDTQQRHGHRSLKSNRRKIGVFRHPMTTLWYFGKSVGRWAKSSARTVTNLPAFGYIVVPSATAWFLLRTFSGLHSAAIDEVEHYVEFAVWWVGLGILSSVGLGAGIQTGILFLLPHIMKTCLTVEACDSLDFRASGDMWFSNADDMFACPDEGEALFEGGEDGIMSPVSVTYVGTFLKVYPACVLWGIGTAIGEIPPYALSYAAAEAGEDHERGEELRELGDRTHFVGKFDLMTRLKMWMISLLKRKGFLGIFFLSSIPNMAFDLCGMACGAGMMPFWTFFGGTLLGKAVVRVGIQTAFFTMLFHEEHLESFISIVRRWTPSSWDLGGALHGALVQGKARLQKTAQVVGGGDKDMSSVSSLTEVGTVRSRMKEAWTAILVMFVIIFLVSMVDQIARRGLAEEEQEATRVFEEKRRQKRETQSGIRANPASGADNTMSKEATINNNNNSVGI